MPVAFVEMGSFPFPCAHRGSSSGLTFMRTAAEHAPAFVTQQEGSEDITLLDPADESVIRSFVPGSNDTIGSLAFDGEHLRVANVMAASGSFTRPTPRAGLCTALAMVDARHLAIGDSSTSEGVIVAWESLEALGAFPAPGKGADRVHGLARDGGKLFIANQADERIYYGGIVVDGDAPAASSALPGEEPPSPGAP